MEVKKMFDGIRVPLVYGSPGVNFDFVKHQFADDDADLVADVMLNRLVEDSPLKGLESSLVITGAAQTLSYIAPLISDRNVNGKTLVTGLELAIQMNAFTIPKTDFTATIEMVNSLGQVLTSMTQEISGTASVIEGSTRQFVRFLSFEQNSVLQTTGTSFLQDGKTVAPRNFRRHDPAAIALFRALGPPFTDDDIANLLDGVAKDIASINVIIPAGKWTAGVSITVTPILSGRQDLIESIIKSLDEYKDAGHAPAGDKFNVGSIFTGS